VSTLIKKKLLKKAGMLDKHWARKFKKKFKENLDKTI